MQIPERPPRLHDSLGQSKPHLILPVTCLKGTKPSPKRSRATENGQELKFQAFRRLPIHLLGKLQIFNSQRSLNAQLNIGY